MEKDISAFIDEHEAEWPALVTSVARKWLKEGLRERCITRDLKWGVPVNKEGFEGKVFYVWFDAPIEYIAATHEWADENPRERDWKSWWHDAKDVRYVEFMAKDNIPFHTITFPATLLGVKEPWKKVDYIKGFNWLTFYGGKFSTSQKRGIFTNQALEEFTADYWRYWLMANAPENADSSFTFDSFAAMINKDLNDVLGNFVNRVLKMTASKFGPEIPEGGVWGELENDLATTLQKRIADYTNYMEKLEFRKALNELRAIWTEGNNYLTQAAPWTVIKENREKAAMILRLSINLIRLYAMLSRPVIPASSEKMATLTGVVVSNLTWPGSDIKTELQMLKGKAPFNVPEEPLFKKISPEQVETLSTRYGAPKE